MCEYKGLSPLNQNTIYGPRCDATCAVITSSTGRSLHTYIHTYIDYAMNHKNKQIYSNREGATGSHRINDHLRVSTIKTAHRRPLNNNTANNNINTTVKVCRPSRN